MKPEVGSSGTWLSGSDTMGMGFDRELAPEVDVNRSVDWCQKKVRAHTTRVEQTKLYWASMAWRIAVGLRAKESFKDVVSAIIEDSPARGARREDQQVQAADPRHDPVLAVGPVGQRPKRQRKEGPWPRQVAKVDGSRTTTTAATTATSAWRSKTARSGTRRRRRSRDSAGHLPQCVDPTRAASLRPNKETLEKEQAAKSVRDGYPERSSPAASTRAADHTTTQSKRKHADDQTASSHNGNKRRGREQDNRKDDAIQAPDIIILSFFDGIGFSGIIAEKYLKRIIPDNTSLHGR